MLRRSQWHIDVVEVGAAGGQPQLQCAHHGIADVSGRKVCSITGSTSLNNLRDAAPDVAVSNYEAQVFGVLKLGGVGIRPVLSFLVCVLSVLVVVVVPASEFAVFDRVFSSVDPVVLVMNFARPGRGLTSFVDAMLVPGDDRLAHRDREAGALRADIERL